MRITNGGGLLLEGTSIGSVTTSGAGRKVIWNAQRGAFRAGIITGSQWDVDSLGVNSIALGNDPVASGIESIAIGSDNVARGYKTLALGSSSEALGDSSVAIGVKNYSGSSRSTTFGYADSALAENAIAIGNNNVARGVSSIAIGETNVANDTLSIAVGQYAQANGTNSRAFGADVQANNPGSMAIGHHVKTTADGAIIIGNGTVSSNFPREITTKNDVPNSLMISMSDHLNAKPDLFVRHNDDSGNGGFNSFVGIGTKNPTYNLEVLGSLKASFMRLDDPVMNPLVGAGHMIVNSGDGNMQWVDSQSGAAPWGLLGNYASSNHFIGTLDDNSFKIKTNDELVAEFANGGALLLSGNNFGTVPSNIPAGPHLLWSPQKRAFRTVELDSASSWLPSNIGFNSFAHGFNASASGLNAVAMGSFANASGNTSFAFGGSSLGAFSVALGAGSVASLDYSIAIGYDATASQSNSIAIGNNLNASNGIAIGRNFTNNAPNHIQLGINRPIVTIGYSSVGINDSTPSSTATLSVIGENQFQVATFKTTSQHAWMDLLASGAASGLVRLRLGTVSKSLWDFRVSTTAGNEDLVFQSYLPSWHKAFKLSPEGQLDMFVVGTSIPQIGISSSFSASESGTKRILYNEFKASNSWFGTKNEELVLSSSMQTDRPDLVITSSGDIGLGVAVPSVKLDIDGGINAVGSIQLGGSIDATGGLQLGGSINAGGSIQLGGATWSGSASDRQINFGDADFVHIGEIGEDDKLELKGKKIYFNSLKTGFNETNPLTKLHVSGGQWDVSGTNGDMMIGDATVSMKFGVATVGGGAGSGRINMVGGSSKLILGGGGNDVLTVNSTSVGIGTTNPAYQLQLTTNSAAKPVSSAWTVASDARLKTNVHSFNDGLNLIEKINPVWFTYNGLGGMSKETGVGTIAQELQEIAPYMIKKWKHKDENGTETEYLGVDYGAMDFVLVNAIKELNERLTKLEEENRRLREGQSISQASNEK